MINYHKLPLLLNKEVERTYGQIRKIAKDKIDLVRIEKDSELEIFINGIGGNIHFYFQISKPELDVKQGNKVFYTIKRTPRSTSSLDAIEQKNINTQLISNFNGWISMLESYNSLNIHPKDTIEEQYEDEFEDWFEIVDEDADIKAFDTPRQILISNIITKSIEAIRQDGIPDADEIIQEAEYLKENISSLTKRQSFNIIKRLYAKLKIKGGLGKVKKVYDICEKEVIKMGFHFGTRFLAEKFVRLIESLG